MANLQDVKDAIAQEKADIAQKLTELNATVEELKAQIANGGAVTPADLDALIASVHDIFTA